MPEKQIIKMQNTSACANQTEYAGATLGAPKGSNISATTVRSMNAPMPSQENKYRRGRIA